MAEPIEPTDGRAALRGIQNEAIPTVNPAFADRLEADLRIQHAGHRPVARRRSALGGVVVACAAAALVLAGVVGLSRSRSNEPAVPLDVIAQPDDGASEVPSTEALFEPTATATATAAALAPPTLTPQTLEPTAVPEPTARPEATPAPDPTATTLPAPPLAPAPTPTPEPAATAAPTLAPAPTPTPEPTATPTPTPEPAATPTAVPTPEPARIVAACRALRSGEAVGVTCTWEQPVDVAVDAYRLYRTRNGAARELVATLRPATTMAADRDVVTGDTVVYVLQALNLEQVTAASGRIVVEIAGE